MLIFYANFGDGGWQIAPLLFLLPLFLPSLLQLLFGGGFSTSRQYVYDPQYGWQRVDTRPRGNSSSGSVLVPVLLAGALTVSLLRLRRIMQRDGVMPTLQRLFLTGWQGGAGAGGQQQQQRQQPVRTRQAAAERQAAVAALVQQLPLVVHHTREELEAMGVGELKRLLLKAGGQEATCLEKRELVDAVLGGANSTAESCSICCEDYAAGDLLRLLPCRHQFHLECLDRWFLSSATDYSRPPACPVCNAELGVD